MNGATPAAHRKVRLLVVIACFGRKNLDFLRQVIQRYRQMNFDVDITVVSEAPKPLGPDVKVIVGLPSGNPWSLPFAHKKVLAENVDRHDLFIYSEDDIEILEENILAFLRATPQLEASEIAGYLRYETNRAGARILTDIHGSFHWKADSVRRRGPYTIAELTNEHAGFYLLTQAQLRQAIASGGFLRAPGEGRYGLPETAATDPYTRCGLRKVICISHFEDFLIRHMSNAYVERQGLSLNCCRQQIQTLWEIGSGRRPASRLCEVEPQVLQRNWSKCFVDKTHSNVLKMVPSNAATVLSVGAGLGQTEECLRQGGHRVTALPLNSVVGASLSRSGFEVVEGTLERCADRLRGRQFDCVLVSHLIHLWPKPWAMLGKYGQLVRQGGALVVAGYNFEFLPHLLKRLLRRGDYRKLGRFEASGLHPLTLGAVKKQIRMAGFGDFSIAWYDHARPGRRIPLGRWCGRFLTRDWVLRARKTARAPEGSAQRRDADQSGIAEAARAPSTGRS